MAYSNALIFFQPKHQQWPAFSRLVRRRNPTKLFRRTTNWICLSTAIGKL